MTGRKRGAHFDGTHLNMCDMTYSYACRDSSMCGTETWDTFRWHALESPKRWFVVVLVYICVLVVSHIYVCIYIYIYMYAYTHTPSRSRIHTRTRAHTHSLAVLLSSLLFSLCVSVSLALSPARSLSVVYFASVFWC